MTRSRREFLKTAAATTTLTSIPLAAAADATNAAGLPAQTIGLFEALPGDKALKIYAPAVGLKSGILIQSNASKMLFVASAIKTFVLCTALRQINSPDIVRTLEDTELTLDDTVWSFGSPAFNPPNLTGVVSERTTLEAMITRSDNTATDMAFKLAGANNVRAFIAAAGLKNTLVPDSTRALTGYLFGAANYKTAHLGAAPSGGSGIQSSIPFSTASKRWRPQPTILPPIIHARCRVRSSSMPKH